jgi:hypothetical protein
VTVSRVRGYRNNERNKRFGFCSYETCELVVCPIIDIPHEEVGEGILFLASSKVYCCVDRGKAGEGGRVPCSNTMMIAKGTGSKRGTGVFCV